MEEIRRRSRGITDFRLRLYWDEFKNIRIALPPLEEQEEIAAFLDRKLSQIDRQIALIDRLDDLLQQQRKAIIHEAVTGKIDLSDYEPPAQAA
jgi:type I restriction enzyme S subunit